MSSQLDRRGIGGLALALSLVTVVASGCGSGPSTPSATIWATSSINDGSPTPEPTPTPAPTLTPASLSDEQQFVLACSYQIPIAGAAPYAGSVHPLVVLDEGDVRMTMGMWTVLWQPDRVFATNSSWPSGGGLRDLQLILCANKVSKQVASCGSYRNGDHSIPVYRLRWDYRVDVVIAATGAVLRSKTFTGGAPPRCPRSISSEWTSAYYLNGPLPKPSAVDDLAVSLLSGAPLAIPTPIPAKTAPREVPDVLSMRDKVGNYDINTPRVLHVVPGKGISDDPVICGRALASVPGLLPLAPLPCLL